MLFILFVTVNSGVQLILCCGFVLFDFFLCPVSNVQCVSGLFISEFLIAPSVFSNIYMHVPVFNVYPHTSMEFATDQGELYVIILLNDMLGTNNVAIIVE